MPFSSVLQDNDRIIARLKPNSNYLFLILGTQVHQNNAHKMIFHCKENTDTTSFDKNLLIAQIKKSIYDMSK